MTRRLNARIDAELARKVKILRERESKTTTEIVRDSIEAYYARASEQRLPAELLRGFVGVANGAANLATDYKQHLTHSLERKGRR